MKYGTIITAIFTATLLAGLVSATGNAAASPAQRFEKTAEICKRETAGVERDLGIPAGLLGAISLAETGRWDSDREASFAWPWTIMAEGRGRYFDSKADAIAEVERLMAKGVTNIDVGCMQVNLYYHGGAFADLDQALDPAANAAYAGEYLKNLHGAAGSWETATGYYHSTTPERSESYREKVVALWERTGRQTPADIDPRGRPGTGRSPTVSMAALSRHATVSIDMARTAELNARLRIARAETRQADFETRRQRDLALWREADTGRTLQLAAKVRRARAAATAQRELETMGKDRSQSFAERRRDQLRRWRLSTRKADTPS